MTQDVPLPDAPRPTPPAGHAVRFYGRRKGKPLKAARQALIESSLPRLRLEIPDAARSLDPTALCAFVPQALRLEIGFGSGEHLAEQAAANPDIGFIGSEVFLNGVASLVRYIDERALTNVRVFDDDARYLLPALRDRSLARISLLFPDPWPKARHAKRRLISAATLDECARVLAHDGELRVASDHSVYVEWALRHGAAHTAFQWVVSGPEDWRSRPADSTVTRYERKALTQGRKPVFLTFRRVPESV